MADKSILVVEDDSDIREVFQELLEGEGYRVTLTSNGKEALDFLRLNSNWPNLILLDLMMPVMDGLTFIKEFEEAEEFAGVKKPSIIVVSAAGGKMPETVTGFIRKPVGVDELLKVAQKYCA